MPILLVERPLARKPKSTPLLAVLGPLVDEIINKDK